MAADAGQDASPPGVLLFSYHRAIAPMMWVLFGLICIEAAVTHFLIALWNVPIAIFLSVISLATAAWLIFFLRSLRKHPLRLSSDGLVWPVGSMRAVIVPLSQIRERVEQWTLDGIRRDGLFNAALIAHPNIVLSLDPPICTRRRTIRYLAHRLDDPQAFNAALDALMPRP